jgi:hypothetical protein
VTTSFHFNFITKSFNFPALFIIMPSSKSKEKKDRSYEKHGSKEKKKKGQQNDEESVEIRLSETSTSEGQEAAEVTPQYNIICVCWISLLAVQQNLLTIRRVIVALRHHGSFTGEHAPTASELSTRLLDMKLLHMAGKDVLLLARYELYGIANMV